MLRGWFCTFVVRIICLKQKIEPLDPFLDTNDDGETHSDASQSILKNKNMFDIFQLAAAAPLSRSIPMET